MCRLGEGWHVMWRNPQPRGVYGQEGARGEHLSGAVLPLSGSASPPELWGPQGARRGWGAPSDGFPLERLCHESYDVSGFSSTEQM